MSTAAPQYHADALLTVEEAAAYLHASRATVFRLIKTNHIASIKVGKSRLIRFGALVDFVHRQEKVSA